MPVIVWFHMTGTTSHFPHQYCERRIGDIHLHRGNTSYDASDVGDDNDVWMDESTANIEYDMIESERNETTGKEKTRAGTCLATPTLL